MSSNQIWASVVSVVVLLLVLLVGWPQYRVWSNELRGKATLREAEWDRQVAVEEAQAVKEASILYAERDSIQAMGVASANRILGESLRNNEEYLRYLWIQGLNDGNSEVIYVPTEANLPLLEARNRP